MTDTRTYDADSDVDSEQMTQYDPIAEMNAQSAAHAATRQQLAEAMALVAQQALKLADVQTCLNLSEHLRQEQATELEEAKHLRDAWKREAMEARAERAQLVTERDEARRTADEAVSAIAVVQARLHGMGWYC